MPRRWWKSVRQSTRAATSVRGQVGLLRAFVRGTRAGVPTPSSQSPARYCHQQLGTARAAPRQDLQHSLHPEQAARRHWGVGALDRHHLRFAEDDYAPDELRGRIAEHDPAGRRRGLHSLRHPDLLADCGVTNCGGTELAGNHLARVQAHPQKKAEPSCRSISAAIPWTARWISRAARQARNAWSSRATGAPNTAMMPSPVNWSTVAP